MQCRLSKWTAGLGRPIGPPFILFVDDEFDILPEYQDLFEGFGISSIIASDPFLALQLLDEQPEIRLVITDLRMPRMDGKAMIAAMREGLPDSRQIAFILLTGEIDATIDDLGGQIAQLPKPVDPEELLHRVHVMLNMVS